MYHDSEREYSNFGNEYARFQFDIPGAIDVYTNMEYWVLMERYGVIYRGFATTIAYSQDPDNFPSMYRLDQCWNDPQDDDNCIADGIYFVRVCYQMNYDYNNPNAVSAWDSLYCDYEFEIPSGSWHLESINPLDKLQTKYGIDVRYNTWHARAMMGVRNEGYGQECFISAQVDDVKVVRYTNESEINCPAIRIRGAQTASEIWVGSTDYSLNVPGWNIAKLDSVSHAVLEVRNYTDTNDLVDYINNNLKYMDMVLVTNRGAVTCDDACSNAFRDLGGAGYPFADSNPAAVSLIGLYGAATRTMPMRVIQFVDGDAEVENYVPCHKRDLSFSEMHRPISYIGYEVGIGNWTYELARDSHGYLGCYRFNVSAGTEWMIYCYGDWRAHTAQRCSICCETYGFPYMWLRDNEECRCSNNYGTNVCDDDQECGQPQLDDSLCNDYCPGAYWSDCGNNNEYYAAYTVSGSEYLYYGSGDIALSCNEESGSYPCTNLMDNGGGADPRYESITTSAANPTTINFTFPTPQKIHQLRIQWRYTTSGHAEEWGVWGLLPDNTTYVKIWYDSDGWITTNKYFSVTYQAVYNFTDDLFSKVIFKAFDGGTLSRVRIAEMGVTTLSGFNIEKYANLRVNKADYNDLLLDYTPIGKASPSHFRLSDLLEIDTTTGQLVLNFLLFNFEAQPYYMVTQSAVDNKYDSGWFIMNRDKANTTFFELPHGLGALPLSVNVRAHIAAGSGYSNDDYYWNGVGAVFADGAEVGENYGGVLYGYNESHFRVWIPSDPTYGHALNVGNGWGQTNLDAVIAAEVRVKASLGTTPDKDSGWLPMCSQCTNTQLDYVHNLGDLATSIVKVVYRATDGPNAGYVFDAAGSAQADDDGGRYGGIIFGYDNTTIRVWAPNYTDSSNDNCAVGFQLQEFSDNIACYACTGWAQVCDGLQGHAVFIPESFGNGMYNQSSDNIEVRVLIWQAADSFAISYASNWEAMSANGKAYVEDNHNLGYVPTRAKLVAKIDDDTNDYVYWHFEGFGAVQGDDIRVREYGGVVFNFDTTSWRAWAPALGPGGHSHVFGLFVAAGDGWGNGTKPAEALKGVIRMIMWEQDATTLRDTLVTNITITDTNEAPFVFVRDTSVDEGEKIDTIVGTPTAYDPDGDILSNWSIVEGNDAGAFYIDSSGNVKVNDDEALDYEAYNNFTLRLRISDGHMNEDAFMFIEVIDGNDIPIIYPPYWRAVREDSPKNTKVGDPLNATEPDLTQSILFYLLDPGNWQGTFFINRCDGQIRLRYPDNIDFENVTGRNFFAMTVLVTDDGPDAGNVTGDVYINVTDGNDSPYWNGTFQYDVEENTPNGTFINGTLNDYCFDDDIGDWLTYAIIYIVEEGEGGGGGGEGGEGEEGGGGGGAGGSTIPAFVVNASSGELIVGSALLDYEAGQQSFEVNVRCTDNLFVNTIPSSQLSADESVFINVLDANDPPEFSKKAFVMFATENPSVVPVVVTGDSIGASDEDIFDSFTYSLADDYGGIFSIDPSTGVLEVISMALDYEAGPIVNLTVVATDLGILTGNKTAPPENSTAIANVKIQNVNEAPYVAHQVIYVKENTVGGTTIGYVNGSDPDIYTTTDIDFTLVSTYPGGHQSDFTIINTFLEFECELRLANNILNYENETFMNLTFDVEDNEDLPGSGTIQLALIDQNDPPAFNCPQVGFYCDTIYVNETHPDGSGIVNVSTYDEDGHTILHSIGINSDSYIEDRFNIRDLSGEFHVELSGNNILDFETKMTPATLEVQLLDQTTFEPGNFTVTRFFEVWIVDVNEPPRWDPETLAEVLNITVVDNKPDGINVGVALDGNIFYDEDIGDDLLYTLGTKGLFIPNGQSNGNFTPNVLEIHNRTGQMSIPDMTLLDAGDEFYFNMTVSDGLLSETFNFNLFVTADNDPPVFVNETLDCNVSEDVMINDVICWVNATDSDPDSINFFFIPSSSLFNVFTIHFPDPSQHQARVTPKQLLNYEVLDQYKLDIMAKDDHGLGKFALSTIRELTINVLDANDVPTSGNSTFNFTVNENELNGIQVGKVMNFEDEDGDTLSFTLQNDTGLPFTVNTLSGLSCQLEVDGAIDYEALGGQNYKYDLVLDVDDGNGGTLSLMIQVDVNDINEPPSLASYNLTVDENSVVGTLLEIVGGGTQISGDDPENDVLDYDFVITPTEFAINDVGSYFTIEVDNAPPDYEAQQTYQVDIEATESATTEMYSVIATLYITIVNLNDVTISNIEDSGGEWNKFDPSGGDIVTITGTDFGNIGSSEPVTVTFGPYGWEYAATGCSVQGVSNVEIQCSMPAGFGIRHIWNVTVDSSMHSYQTDTTLMTSFARPRLSGIVPPNVVKTEGGSNLQMVGNEIGNTSVQEFHGYVTVRSFQTTGNVTIVSLGTNSSVLAPYRCMGGLSMATLEAGDIFSIDCDTCSDKIKMRVTEHVDVPFDDDNIVLDNHCAFDPSIDNGWSNVVTTLDQNIDEDIWSPDPPHSLIPVQWVKAQLISGTIPGSFTTVRFSLFMKLKPALLLTQASINSFGPGVYTYNDGNTVNAYSSGWWVDTQLDATLESGVGTGFYPRLAMGGVLSDLDPSSIDYNPPIIRDLLYCDGCVGDPCPSCMEAYNHDFATEGTESVHVIGVFLTGSESEYEGSGNGETQYGPGYISSCVEVTPPTSVPSMVDYQGEMVTVNALRCGMEEGVGAGHTWSVTVGDQTSWQSYGMNYTSYKRPNVTKMYDQDWPFPTTAGGDPVTIEGANFGPVTLPAGYRDIVGYYGSDDQFANGNVSYLFHTEFDSCEISIAHTQLVCDVGEGTGLNHSWRLDINNQTSDVFDSDSGYSPPILGAFSVDLNSSLFPDDTESFNTEGGENVFIEGFNFGAIAESGEYAAPLTAKATWIDDDEVEHEFTYDGCNVIDDHVKMQCTVQVGVGSELEWTLTVDGQTNVYATTSYGDPKIFNITGQGFNISDGLDTEGGQVITLTGENFGDDPAYLERVSYGPTGSEYLIHDSNDPTNQCPTVDHEELICTTAEGIGQGHTFSVVVGGQKTSSSFQGPPISYKAPILNDVSPVNGTTAGGYFITMTGENFGPRETLTLKYWNQTMDLADIVTDYSTGHNTLRLRMDPGMGEDRGIQVNHQSATCTGSCEQFSNVLTFDYTRPQIAAFVARELPNDPSYIHLTLTAPSSLSLAAHEKGGSFGTGPVDLVVSGGIEVNGSTYPAYYAKEFTRLDDSSTIVYTGDTAVEIYATDIFPNVTRIPWPITTADLAPYLASRVYCVRPDSSLPLNSIYTIGHTHDTIGCITDRRNGTLVIRSGNLITDAWIYADLSPIVDSITVNGSIPTKGGSLITIQGRFIGDATEGDGQIHVLFRLADPDDPSIIYMDDERCMDVSITEIGEDIDILTCEAPAGIGKNVTVTVRRVSGELTSVSQNGSVADGGVCFPCVDYSDPVIETYSIETGSRRRLMSGMGDFTSNWPIDYGTGVTNITFGGYNFGPTLENLIGDPIVRLYVTDSVGTVELTPNINWYRAHHNISFELPTRVSNKTFWLKFGNVRIDDTSGGGGNFWLDTEQPTITYTIGTNLGTEGGDPVTIQGVNFGLPDAAVSGTSVELEDITGTHTGQVNVLLQGETIEDGLYEELVSWSHDEIIFLSPAGVGVNNEVILQGGASTTISASSGGGGGGITFNSPMIHGFWPTNGPTVGFDLNGTQYMYINGSNLGDENQVNRTILFNGHVINSSSIYWHNSSHDFIEFFLPPGQGINLEMKIDIGGQKFISSETFSYDPPRLDAIMTSIDFDDAADAGYTLNPSDNVTSPTHACDKLQDANAYYAASTDNFFLQRGCSDFTNLYLYGDNFGTHSLKVVVGTYECRTDANGVYTNGTEVGHTTWDCTDLASTGHFSDVFTHTDDYVSILGPSGEGLGLIVQIEIYNLQDVASIVPTFDYRPPDLVLVNPGFGRINDDDWYDALGDSLTIIGENFGHTLSGTYIQLGDDECTGSVWHDADRNGYGLPYITCNTPNAKLGAKKANITVAHQSIIIPVNFVPTATYIDGNSYTGNFFNSICKTTFINNVATIYYGLPFYEEYCAECPKGATCKDTNDNLYLYYNDPIALPEYWKSYYDNGLSRAASRCDFERRDASRTNRTECPDFLGCVPEEACEGNNVCKKGYEYLKNECETKFENVDDAGLSCVTDEDCNGGKTCDHRKPEACSECVRETVYDATGTCECTSFERCAFCTVYHYYKINGKCQPCPQNVWVIIALFVTALVMFAVAGYVLNKKNFNLAFISIGFDYFQVLAVFASSDVPWPNLLIDFFRFIEFFSFDIDITAPECVMPDFTYELKWTCSMLLPIAALAMFILMHFAYAGEKFIVKGIRSWKKLNEHHVLLIAMFTVMLYYLYLPLTRKVLEIFNCNPAVPDDGYLYTEWTSINCEGGLCRCWKEGQPQMQLFPWAIMFFCFYSIGFPVFAAYIIVKNFTRLKEDQLLRAMNLGNSISTNPDCYGIRQKYHKLYYHFKPGKVYWILVIIARKFFIAMAALMFRDNPSFQLSFILLVLFTSFVLQVKHRPFMSSVERENEIEKHKIKVEEERKEVSEADSTQDKISNYVHIRIAEHLEKIERQQEIQSKRKRRVGHINEDEKDNQELSAYFWDYNTVELFLLGCAIFVCVSGVMFESQNFSSRSDLSGYMSALAGIVMTVIIFSLVYYGVVFFSEVFAALGLQNNKFFLSFFLCLI